jgi:carbonic anhydrase
MESEQMNTITISQRLTMVLACSAFTCAAYAAEAVHWSYSGDTGPENWGTLSEDFAACRVGKNQSPIDIITEDMVEAELDPLILEYKGQTTEITNNGHALQLSVTEGSVLKVEGQEFKLVQFHMHSPSEHKINGESFPLEVHFVHQNDSGELAVVGRLYREGKAHSELWDISQGAPKAGNSVPFVKQIEDVFPNSQYKVTDYYRYEGSLTTPPCTEGLRWYVYPTVGTVSPEQIDNYIELIGADARNTQPINARMVLHTDD